MPIDSNNLDARLSNHPELHAKIEKLLGIVESTGDDLALADEAERQVIETLRQMGHDALSAWATQRVAQTSAQSDSDSEQRSCGQKNFTGEAPTASSK